MLMEGRAEGSDGSKVVKKSRSLDLQSLYDQKTSIVAGKKGSVKRKWGQEDGSGVNKKSQKEVVLSIISSGEKKRRKSSVEQSGECGTSDSGKLETVSSQNWGVFGGISLDLSENIVRVPKRKRNLVRRRKVDVNIQWKEEEPSSNKSKIELAVKPSESAGEVIASAAEHVEGAGKTHKPADGLTDNAGFDGNSCVKAECNGTVLTEKKIEGNGDVHTKVKQKKSSHGCKGNGSGGNTKKEDALSPVHNDTIPPKKIRKTRKEKGTDNLDYAMAAKPVFDDAIRSGDDSQDDNEENLEANAARMLSSRFDPSCTGFGSGNKSSQSDSADGLPSWVSSRGFTNPLSDSRYETDAACSDADARVLRPRDQHNRKGHFRKRRHFYEVLSGDFNAFWALNRRIKVFWPLDRSWYIGHVIGYDPDKKLHHIKYDDREEEWIDLQHERFKFLLFPSEVPSSVRVKNATKGEKDTTKDKCREAAEGDGHANTFMDSEPIGSWLARSTRRVKSIPVDTMKEEERRQHTTFQPSVSESTDGVTGCLSVSSFMGDRAKLMCNSSPSGLLCRPSTKRDSFSEMSSRLDENKPPIVYFRRRFRRRDGGVMDASEENSDQFHNDSLDGQGFCAIASSLEILADRAESSVLVDSSLGWLDDVDGPFLSAEDSKLLKLVLPTSCMKLLQSVQPIPRYSFGIENVRLFHTILMFHYGSLVAAWPIVRLEMLFVDDKVGLRFILLQGCLMQALACVLLILSMFQRSSGPSQHPYQHLPVTTIRFKFSLCRDSKKGIMTEFYFFREVGKNKWLNLDRKLKQYSLLFKQLSLSECTYDNIKGLEGSCCPLVSEHLSGMTFSKMGVGEISRQHEVRVSGGKSGLSVGMPFKVFTLSNDQKASTNYMRTSGLPPFALLFSAAPTFFLQLHLKLLMERSIHCVNFLDGEGCRSLMQYPQVAGSLVNVGCTDDLMNSSMNCSRGSNLGGISQDSSGTEQVSCSNSDVENDDISAGQCDGELISQRSDCYTRRENLNGRVIEEEITEGAETDARQCDSSQQTSDSNHLLLETKDRTGFCPINGITVEIPTLNPREMAPGGSTLNGHHSSVAWNMIDGITFSPDAIGSTSGHGDGAAGSGSGSSLMRSTWDALPDSRADFIQNGFGKGHKKPRTQVSYSLPSVSYDSSPKSSAQPTNGFSHKRIRRSSEKRTTDATRLETSTLTCDANLLVTADDRGWRECGARIVHELADHNEWRLVVKISGTIKYTYKATQSVQPGTVNRFNHAMMWKGGKEWALEFPDRSQWVLFKEIHEECYNRNIRAALVKNIPIPGVRVIEEVEVNGAEVPFVRPALKYFRQVETDVEMAMDLSRILYDMDSDDELWISNVRSSALIPSDISDDLFEKVMDLLEKAAYARQQDLFSSDELEDLLVGVGPSEVIKTIYNHWRQKRQKKGLPLIRHFQPPLWQKYQQQMKEWELAVMKCNTGLSNGCHEKAARIEKPTMFSFCLKPRGLEVPHKISKQRSQKKVSISAQNNFSPADCAHLYPYGKRLNRPLRDEKFTYVSHNDLSSELSPVLQASASMFSPGDAGAMGYFSLNGDVSKRTFRHKLHRNKSKKMGSIFGTNEPYMSPFYNQKTLSKGNGLHGWTNILDGPSAMPYQLDGSQLNHIEQLDDSDIDEFRLRDAASAAQHAINMAKLKREKAQRLLYRADLAIHKAVVALMTAEAIKAASEELSEAVSEEPSDDA